MRDVIIENVIVDNGIEKHKVQYVYSPSSIVTCANRALFFVSQDVKKEINDKKLTVLIFTDSLYEDIKSKTIIGADNDLLFRFNGIK